MGGANREFSELVERLKRTTAAELRASAGSEEAIQRAIVTYLQESYRLGLVAGEIVELFCVDTPCIAELAGFTGARGESVVMLFDQFHERVRAAL